MNLLHLQIAFALGLSLVCGKLYSEDPSRGKQVEQQFVSKDAATVSYLLYLPSEYQAGKKLPLMLFLHGRGESNGPLSLVSKWGPPQLAARGEHFPFILVSPQCPRDDNWASPTQQTRLGELLDAVISKYGADKSRIYLSGLSMGGAGSWRMAADNATRFAAVVPICGRGNLKDVDQLKNVPIWVFVGDQDGVYQSNVELKDAIVKAGSQSIRLTTLENIGHNSWSAAYASPDLYSWLEKQSLTLTEK
ncbi:MAG: alpha/beta hydrolase-fold protein [Pirellula sp.]